MQNSPARSGIDVGSVIADTYTIEALIGRGGMGAVFLASHKRLPGKKVAIKLLHAELSGEEILARFKREAEIASKLAHPNIVGVHDYNVTPDGTPYVVLDYLEGASLAHHLKDGPLPLERVISIVRQVGSALAAAHREGIVHRDLKPQNIFLVPTEAEGRPVDVAKVLDFGISKIRGSDTVKTQDSTLLGTPQYMAPEQATGQHDKVDERTDLFALGAIVYEMLTGQPAFSGASIPEVVFKVVYEQPVPLAKLAPDTPAHVVAAVERAMAKQQADRFADVGVFVEALTGQPLSVVRPPALPSAGGTTRSRSTGKEAFDQTVGSGDHGPTVVPPVPVRGSAPTVESKSEPIVRVPAPRRTTWLVAGAAVVLIAGGIYLVATKSRGEVRDIAVTRDERPVAVAVEPPLPDAAAPPVVVDAAAPAVVVDAAPAAPPAAPPVTAKGSAAPVEHKRPAGAGAAGKPAPDESDDAPASADDDTPAKLAQAEAALARSDYPTAEQLSNAVINGEHTRPGQKARAHVVHGIVECAAHNDRGLALADLRAITGPRLRRKLIDGCAVVKMPLDDAQ